MNSITIHRNWITKLYLSQGTSVVEVLETLEVPGEMIKDGDKRTITRVGDWVLKATRINGGIGPLKMTTNRDRYRNGWVASIEMARLGIPVPKTIAYVEYRLLGFIWRSVFIYKYLEGHQHVIEYLSELTKKNDPDEIEIFFSHFSDALKSLADKNVFHRDLKLSNVLTNNGKTFYFIDLDEAHLNQPFLPEHRLRNHIQMANGLSTVLDRDTINAFLTKTTPKGENTENWIEQVWIGVEQRLTTGEPH